MISCSTSCKCERRSLPSTARSAETLSRPGHEHIVQETFRSGPSASAAVLWGARPCCWWRRTPGRSAGRLDGAGETRGRGRGASSCTLPNKGPGTDCRDGDGSSVQRLLPPFRLFTENNILLGAASGGV